MSITTRKQDYKYQTKTVSLKDGLFMWDLIPSGSDYISLEVAVPEDMIELKGLCTKIILDASGIVNNAKIASVGPKDNMQEVNIDFVDGKAEIVIDFSHMVDEFKLNNGLIGTVSQPFISVYLKMAGSPQATGIFGKVKLWKVDLIYTTVGIR